ncbi:MAG: trehalose-6-phosphate synthase [Anaerolineales bacterium]|nr:trehalose-6-phosphate synthase [Anaerolineales bacterium]
MSPETDSSPLIVIASNRGPFSFKRRGRGFGVERGVGGLVTALGALAEGHDVLWVAAAMSPDDLAWSQQHKGQTQKVEGISLKLVEPPLEEYEGYYNEISNPLLWFIQHQLWDTPRTPSITEHTWQAWEHGYKPVNRRFAEAIAEAVRDSQRQVIVLPQDYHLYMVPHYLRALVGEQVQIQPFVHIPWPGPDAWRILPPAMRDVLLASLLEANRVGFQTEKDAFNFVQTCRFYLGAHAYGRRDAVEYKGRDVGAVPYPISIDVEKVQQLAAQQVTELERGHLHNSVGDRQVILRVDRVEPSKNNLRGMQAYRALLEKYPQHRGKVQLLALLVPSRMEVGEYRDYLGEIMAEAGTINAQYSGTVWEPVRIIVGDNYMRAIAAMQMYDVLLVNPLADGMNLVAKEGVLVNNKNGVLVLSEYAGAFFELGEHALIVSPFDVYGTAEAMHQALTMPMAERQQRAAALRQIVTQADVREWFAAQVDDALRAASSQASKSSTSATPEASQSAVSSRPSGASGD